ncbi:MAG: SDR family NAD(P)-dependent oxidoreductase, partial [Gammaproteobacteria bacterium]|nr:SDR family NAD(P)-dependent oxidoreductase [Gammaproteobacteria bacterium]
VLSVYALASHPEYSTYSASQAAAHSLSKGLRNELSAGGVKLINVFPGPIEDEWQQLLPPPKLAPETLARAVTNALREGTEDVYPGAVAEELLARLRENPKEVERELTL